VDANEPQRLEVGTKFMNLVYGSNKFIKQHTAGTL